MPFIEILLQIRGEIRGKQYDKSFWDLLLKLIPEIL